jgi:hypothetical protein
MQKLFPDIGAHGRFITSSESMVKIPPRDSVVSTSGSEDATSMDNIKNAILFIEKKLYIFDKIFNKV